MRYLRQIGNLFTDLDITQLAFFAQDTWRMTPEFTLNYGLRWEGQYNPTPDVSNTTLLDRVRGVNFPIGSVDPSIIPDATDQIMPRIGFAWLR